MNGGKTILSGLLVLLIFLLHLTLAGGFEALVVLLKGGVPIALIAVGATMLYIGLSDLKSIKAEAAAGGSEG